MTAIREPEVSDPLLEAARTALGAEFDRALDAGEVEVHYLPIVRLTDRCVVAVEALARWQRDGEAVPAAEFLDVARDAGRMVDLDRFMLERSCAAVARWNSEHADRPPLRIAVNVSLEALLAADVGERVDAVLRDTCLDPRLLCLEIEEHSLLELGDAVEPVLDSLKQLGVRLALDRVSAGPSSLLVVRRHRFDELKIDRSIVARIDTDEDAAAVVRALVRVARALEVEPVAEGVERPAQEKILRAMRCHQAQGWRFGRPGTDIDVVVAGAASEEDGAGLPEAPTTPQLWGGMPRSAIAKFLEAVLESAPMAMTMVDQSGRHVLANPAAAELLGRTVPELLTASCWETVHPADLQADLDGMEQILRGERVSYVVEQRVIDPSGAERWVELIVSSIPGAHLRRGAPVFVLRQIRSTAEDHKASQDAAVLRSIIAAEPDAMIIADSLGRCTHWNAAAEKLFGWTASEIEGLPLARLVGPAGQFGLARVVSDVATGATVRWPDATWRSASGTPLALDVTMGPVVDPGGATIGMVAMARDVADRRAAEDALRDAHRSLTARASDLADANGRLASFAATLSHDLRQPLAVLDGYLTLLEQQADELDEEHRSWLQGALRGKDRMAAAIDALHRNAVAEEVPLTSVDLREVVAEAVADLPAEPGLRVDVGELPTVLGDRGFLRQVFVNLFQNSLRYRSADRPLVISVTAEPTDAGWQVSVTDTGRGIAPEELVSVFQAGRRGRASEGTPGSGTGLSTVRSLVTRLGGEAWAEEHTDGAHICLRLLPDD